jgi:hypothetical protein
VICGSSVNEETDAREIGHVEITAAEKTRQLSSIDDILSGKTNVIGTPSRLRIDRFRWRGLSRQSGANMSIDPAK